MKFFDFDKMFASMDKTIEAAFVSMGEAFDHAFTKVDANFAEMEARAVEDGVETIREEETRPDGTRIVRVMQRRVQVHKTP